MRLGIPPEAWHILALCEGVVIVAVELEFDWVDVELEGWRERMMVAWGLPNPWATASLLPELALAEADCRA